MSATTTQSEMVLSSMLDERDKLTEMHEQLLARIQTNENKLPDEVQKQQLEDYRDKAKDLDERIVATSEAVEANRRAMEMSKTIRRALAGNVEGVEVSDDGIVYRDFHTFARDYIITRDLKTSSAIAQRLGTDEVNAARERIQLLKRAPANTLSSNVGGLIPDQHIAQIFQVIDSSRPLVASAFRSTLERGQLTYPKITQRPVVAVQATEKTEAGNTGMVVDMETATASTYLGGGDLSWQAINWSTPDALELWFRLAAADYALKTEQDAGEILDDAAFLNVIGSPLGATPSYADFLTAVAAGLGEVYANSGGIATTLYLAPDRAFYLLGLTSEAQAIFANGSLNARTGDGNIASLGVVVSRGLDSGVMAVGIAEHLIVAETAGAPVELRVVEPAIGGVEVGIIGAFEAVVAQDESFALLTTAS
jgi:HK97 family phage major capsid protein